MKKFAVLIIPVLCYAILSCGGGEEITEDTSIVADDNTNDKILNDVVTNEGIKYDKDNCDKDSSSNWTDFIGIPYGISEVHLDTIFGESSGGTYSDDSSSFVYYYKKVPRVPISVWANSRTSQVETIFIEVTSTVQFFESDLGSAQYEYDLPICDMKWFGMEAKEVKKIMGTPDKEEVEEDDEGLEITSLIYDFMDEEKGVLRSVVNFRFYESQDNMCSLVMVNWFY